MPILTNACWLNADGLFESGTLKITDNLAFSFPDPKPKKSPHLLKAPDSIRLTLDHLKELWSHNGVFDVNGLLIVPGIVDSHTHFREPGQVYKEGVLNASKAALKGGVTTVLDMPNNKPPCSSLKRVREKRAIFEKKCLVNWGLHLQALYRGPYEALPGLASVKVYMVKSSSNQAIHQAARLKEIFAAFPVVMIHAEDETRFLTDSDLKKQDPSFSRTRYGNTHHLRRPKSSVTAALDSIQQAYQSLPKHKRPRIVIAHLSTEEEIRWVSAMKKAGHDVWGETCPHYALFNDSDYAESNQLLKVNPPLRGEKDRQAVLKALAHGEIDFISSDHAPHTQAEKLDAKNPPSGIPGIEWLGSIVATMAYNKQISWKRFYEVSRSNACSCFNIPNRPVIGDRHIADLTFLSIDTDWFTSGKPITKAAYNPYINHTFTMVVTGTVVNGRLVHWRGAYSADIHGREVFRDIEET